MDKKLYRSQSDKMIGGVCGGLAQRFNIDSSMVRLAFVLLFLLGGHGLLLLVYLVMWMIVPAEPPTTIIDAVSRSEPPTL
jgi:phage shock protein C